ncbi:hypothetical protein H4582DRAFT_2069242 [Lactarius indigo]|nr:hypothetical protein H4582DRAFT_2069242 [Lactarius indigo]
MYTPGPHQFSLFVCQTLLLHSARLLLLLSSHSAYLTTVLLVHCDYILNEYLPAGIVLTQYHHIRHGDADALLKHWTTRQAARQVPFRFKKGDKPSRQSNTAEIGPGNGEEEGLDGIRNEQPQGSDGESQGYGKDSAAEEAREGDADAEDPGPRKLLCRHVSSTARPNKVSEESTAELPTKGDRTNPPPHQPPHSHTNSSQPGAVTKAPAAPSPGSQTKSIPQWRSPKSVLKEPWVDKFNFLALLSKDGKYQDLLLEINKMFLSNRVINIKLNTRHPTWAQWTWTQAWLPKAFHSGGDKPVWEWLQSRPHVPDPSLERARHNFSVDGIVLGIGCILHDLEAMQFSDEFHPPEHIAHSKLSFGVVESIIYPVLDDFSEIIKDHNNAIATNDSQELPAPVAPPSASTERRGKRHRKVKGSDDSDADAHVPNCQKVDRQIGGALPQAWRSGQVTRPTEWAKVTKESGDMSARKK